MVLAELGRIRQTWQNLAECGGERHIAGKLPAHCRRLRQSRSRSLVAKSVETGGRV